MWGECWFAHSEEELRCRQYAIDGSCSAGDFCSRKHTQLSATGKVILRHLKKAETIGERPDRGHLTFVRSLPSLAQIIPPSLYNNVASCSEEARRKKGYYGWGYLKEKRAQLTLSEALSGWGWDASTFLRDMLSVEATQSISDVRSYDLHDAVITPTNGLFRIDCKGLAEKRPSVLRGDKVKVRDNRTMRWHDGFVHFINLDHVLVSFGWMGTCSNTTFLVIFSVPHINWRKQFSAINEAPIMTQRWIHRNISDTDTTPVGQLPIHWANYLDALSVISPNYEQKEAIRRMLCPLKQNAKYGLVVLHGPPGTGKTTTLVAAIIALLKSVVRHRILVVTPSNEAANLVMERVVNSAPFFLHVSKHARILAESYNIADCPKEIQQFARPTSRIPLPALEQLELVVCTLMVAGSLHSVGLDAGSFSHIVIDEAGQATETEVLVPLQFASAGKTTITLAGDHKQLGPVLRSMACQKFGFGVSLLERVMEDKTISSKHSVQLRSSYRAHPSIMAVYNELTYKNTLQCAAPKHNTDLLVGSGLFPSESHPLAFHHMEGKESREADSPSWKNEGEAQEVVDLVERVLQTNRVKFEDIVVLTPYLKQCMTIRHKLHFKFESGQGVWVKPFNYHRSRQPVRVCSVESFQGREAKVVILSCVRSQEVKEVANDHRQNIGFLRQPQRLNVAISRAISALFVVGNIGTLSSDPHWSKLIDIFDSYKALVGVTKTSISTTRLRITSFGLGCIRKRYSETTDAINAIAKDYNPKVDPTALNMSAPTADEGQGDEEMPPMDTDWNRVE